MNYDFSLTKLSKNKFPQDDGLVGTIEFRNLVQFIKGDKKRNFTINIPDIIEYKDAPKQTLPKLRTRSASSNSFPNTAIILSWKKFTPCNS